MDELTNKYNLSLPLAMWLATNEYDGGENPYPQYEMISTTTLLKPTRQFVLEQRLTLEEKEASDVMGFASSKLGHAIHKGMEDAWKGDYKSTLKKLGHSENLANKFVVHPTEPVKPGQIAIYLESRNYRVIDEVVVSGQFDQVIGGQVNDTKSTSVYAYIYGNNDDYYVNQLSTYRWINPELITDDIGLIQHVFTDWRCGDMVTNPKYPPSMVMEKAISLKPLNETQAWVSSRISAIRHNIDLDQDSMVRCTKEELWMGDPVYKYYSDPAKAKEGGRSTRNFDSFGAAQMHLAKAAKGVIVTIEPEPKRCGYCKARPICLQAMEMFNERP